MATKDYEARQKHLIGEHEDVRLSAKYYGKVQNARERNIVFQLSFAKFCELMRQTHCTYTGDAFEVTPEGNTKPHPKQRTIERINPALPYADDNCVAVTYEANQAKAFLDTFLHSPVLDERMKLTMVRRVEYYLRKKVKA